MNPSQNPAASDRRAPMPAEAPQRRQLTAEEVEVLQECARESFWYRCVPLGFAGAVATKALIQKGILKPNPYYGSFPKVSAAILVAYFVGKISYQSTCNEKFLRLENSPIADVIRRKYAMKSGGLSTETAGVWDYSLASQSESDVPSQQKLREFYDDASTSIDTDSTKEVQGLDDTYRPSIDNVTVQRKEQTRRDHVSYDELRQKNREAYERSLMQAPGSQSRTAGRAQASPPSPSASDLYSPSLSTPGAMLDRPPRPLQPKSAGLRKNEYGDVIDD